jgi:hypothetical protein
VLGFLHREGVKVSSRSKILVISFVAVVCGVGLIASSRHHYLRSSDEIDRLSFYRDNLPIGSTRLQVSSFISQHPIRNEGAYGLQHPEEGWLTFPMGEVSGPYYCSRKVSYLYFVFSPTPSDSHGVAGPADDKLMEINLGGELQDCL